MNAGEESGRVGETDVMGNGIRNCIGEIVAEKVFDITEVEDLVGVTEKVKDDEGRAEI